MTKCKTNTQTINTSCDKTVYMNKIMNHGQLMQPTINLKESSWADASYDWYTHEIKFNIKCLRKGSKKYEIEFYEYVARCINHEILHHIFILEHDLETSHDLDNIAKRYKEYWLW